MTRFIFSIVHLCTTVNFNFSKSDRLHVFVYTVHIYIYIYVFDKFVCFGLWPDIVSCGYQAISRFLTDFIVVKKVCTKQKKLIALHQIRTAHVLLSANLSHYSL